MTAYRYPSPRLDTVACPVCREDGVLSLCAANGFDIYRCPKCATDFVAPMPDATVLRKFYDRREWFEAGEWGGYSDYDLQTEPALPFVENILSSFPPDGTVRSILDVGCGFGSHLRLAYDKGWKCFGIEPSAHARSVIQERHGNDFFVVEAADHLLPHEFDLVLLLDVIEHLREPYALLLTLFAKGAITPNTLVAIFTPNARSAKACAAPADWAYRHPPSHLIYFSARSLLYLLQELRFTSIQIDGAHPFTSDVDAGYSDETSELNDRLRLFDGLRALASGSDFAAFMQERYVPGTWSKLAEYEHLPRYRLASSLAAGRTVLDFGCGTGYGSAILADVAASVHAIDIDEDAVQWARRHQRAENLVYEVRSDAGLSLPERSFDLITCFEVIEHVDENTQGEIIANLSRLLREHGALLISTPNPEVTALYGENPYHVRELSEEEFVALLRTQFQYVRVARQSIIPAVVISEGNDSLAHLRPIEGYEAATSTMRPAIFVALCSHGPAAEFPTTCFLDTENDYIAEHLGHAREKNAALFARYKLQEELATVRHESDGTGAAMAETRRLHDVLGRKDEAISQQQGEIHRLMDVLAKKDEALSQQQGEIHRLMDVLATKDEALPKQQGEIHRLMDVLATKDEALSQQQGEINRLTAVIATKDEALSRSSRPRSIG